ncbi:MAG: hypothetical protein EA398_09705 [Deltaproteobacteria bacterium]|nr:MAG: hypothetical protein EA398_09705 [Deltaproteobacteria bacterium]
MSFVRHLPFAFILVALVLTSSTPGFGQNAVVASGSTPTASWFDVGVHPMLSSRSLTIDGDSGRLDYQAPLQPGLALRASVHPLAIAIPDQAWAAPLSIRADISRHSLLSEVDYRSGGRVYMVDVPTRFTTSRFGLGYDIALGPQATLSPTLGLQQLSWSLGYNPRLQSSYYRSLEFGLAGRISTGSLIQWHGQLHLRPGVDPGSTAQSFGNASSGFGLALALGGQIMLPHGLYLDARWLFQHFSLEYTLVEGNTVVARNDATDRFHSLSLGVGFRY